MDEIRYEALSERIYDKSFQQRLPTHGHIELTFRCPLKCVFCYCSCYTSPEYTKNELSTEEVFRILDQAVDYGCLWITFSGGDPFVRKDFREIYDFAYSKGLIISILSSGLLLTEDWLQHLKKFPPLKIEIPLYGIREETYEKVSGKKGSFPVVLKNIRRLLEAGIPLRLKTKLLSINWHEAGEIKKFLSNLGMDFHPNYYLYPRLNGCKEPLAYRLSPNQILELEKEDKMESCDSGTEILSHQDEENPRIFRCAAGVNSFYINPYGELNFCTYVRNFSYNLKRGSIKEGMAWLSGEVEELTYKESSSCRSCKIQSSCQNCPGHAVLETGALDGKSEYLCEVNHTLRQANE